MAINSTSWQSRPPTRPHGEKYNLNFVRTTKFTIEAMGGLGAMLNAWLQGVDFGVQYNEKVGDVIAVFISKAYRCTVDEAWKAMMDWAERMEGGE